MKYLYIFFIIIPLTSIQSQDCNLFKESNCIEDLDKYYYYEERVSNSDCSNFFLDNKSFGKKDLVNLKEFLNEKYESKNLNVIIVLKEKPTAQIKKELLNEEYSNIEIFFVNSIFSNDMDLKS